MKSVVCIHGFGRHQGGRQAGFSSALRTAVEGRLGAGVVWSEVLWDDLLGSPDISSSVAMLRDAHRAVCSFYTGNAGTAIRQRVQGIVADAAAKANGGVVLVGHSFGAAIAYDIVARGLAPDVRDLLMMGAPMGLIRHPDLLVRNMLGDKMRGFGGLLNVAGAVAAQISGMADVDFGQLPAGVRAVAFRNPDDKLSADLVSEFPNVECRMVAPPPGTHGLEHHRLYWHHEDVADWLSRVLATSQTVGGAI